MFPDKHTPAYNAYMYGYVASFKGGSESDNPFILGGKYIHMFCWWYKGFMDGETEKAKMKAAKERLEEKLGESENIKIC